MAIQPLPGSVGAVQAGTARPSRSADGAPAPQSKPPPKPSAEQVKQAVQEIQRVLAPVAQNLQFTVDKETGKTIVRVVDAETETVIRQMPSEEVLAIARALDRLKGVLIRQEA